VRVEEEEVVHPVLEHQVHPTGRVQGSGFKVQGAGFRVQGSGFRVQGSGFRVQGSGFRVQGSGFRVHPVVEHEVHPTGFRFRGKGLGSGPPMVSRGEKMLYSGTGPESYITEYTLVYED